MSEQEIHTGKLIKVDVKEDIETKCKEIYIANGFNIDDWDGIDSWSSWEELFKDALRESYIIISGELYQIEDNELDPYGEIMEATLNPDGSINYHVNFYNGGCSFHEAVETAVDKMNKEIKLTNEEKIDKAIEMIVGYGWIDGSHHKDWVLDQTVRLLAGDRYDDIVKSACDGEDGPDTYEWNCGIAP